MEEKTVSEDIVKQMAIELTTYRYVFGGTAHKAMEEIERLKKLHIKSMICQDHAYGCVYGGTPLDKQSDNPEDCDCDSGICMREALALLPKPTDPKWLSEAVKECDEIRENNEGAKSLSEVEKAISKDHNPTEEGKD